jgi:hypothetical protein
MNVVKLSRVDEHEYRGYVTGSTAFALGLATGSCPARLQITQTLF